MSDDDFSITLSTSPDGIGTLRWTGTPTSEALRRALSHAGDEAVLAHQVRRLEAAAAANDHDARSALLRSGFRQEGIRRQALTGDDGTYVDEVIYARLASDETAGPNAFTAVLNSVLPRTRVIAHALLHDVDHRFVLCRTTFKPDWELPGGIVERHEAPRVGAAREISEELGVDRAIGRLLLVDWLPPYLGWDDALELIFDGGTVTQADLDRFTVDGHEIVEARLVTLSEAAALVTPLSHRRLTLVTGLAPGQMVHTEDGYPVD